MKCFFSKFWHTQLWFHIKENISTEFDAFCSLSFEKKYISSGVWNIYFVDSFLLPFNLGRVPKIHLLRPEFVIVISYELCILCVKKLFGMRIAPKSSSPSAEEKKEKWLWSSWEWGDGMCVAIYFCIGWNFTWFGDPIKLAYQEWRLNCSVFVDAGDPCMKLMNGVLGKSIPGKRFKLIVLLTLSCLYTYPSIPAAIRMFPVSWVTLLLGSVSFLSYDTQLHVCFHSEMNICTGIDPFVIFLSTKKRCRYLF